MTFPLKRQQGFTLIELAIASILVGILLVVLVPNVYDSQNAGRAGQIEQIANSSVANWASLSSATGLPTTISNNVIATTPSNTGVAEVLYVGANRVAIPYQSTYSAIGVKPMNQLVDNPSGTIFRAAGTIEMFVTLSGGGASPMSVQFQNVPLQVTRAVVARLRPDLTVPGFASTTTVGPWSYSCTASRMCTLTFSKLV